uniref:Uncharacterized protein n=1 Tax=Candidatus Kentrum eta TaxID=2126337 RepID=A0A450UDK8_9GAMM|nr:MAG: hypothetical protein BECKH772A_GA0070896_100229 [Candidatus Kentron sp. H]VFJ91680.1 MAG: hypothetical protein BECKH772B_GA0070898_100209 [Candidatus Kentron sp. H]VFJ98293.1 MAG: hypothetical protein BECKH772C_GA0070978_100209 [Candidatus Kentron sp. H]
MSGATGKAATGGVLMLAMTDLFVSATATLLVVLTLASPDSPTPLLVQADLVMLCSEPDAGSAEFALFPASAVAFRKEAGTLRPGTTIHTVSDQTGMARAVAAMELPAKPMLTVALAPAPDRPLTATCFATATMRLLSRYHHLSNDPHEAAVPTLGLQIINHIIRQDGAHE